MTTTSGEPWVGQTAARTVSSRVVVTGFGELCRFRHQTEDDRPERQELLVVSGALVALLEYDCELPLGKHHVVVDVVDLATGDLGVVREELAARRHPRQVGVGHATRPREVGVLGP